MPCTNCQSSMGEIFLLLKVPVGKKDIIWKKTSDVGRKCHLQITFAFEELMGRVLMCFQKKKKKKLEGLCWESICLTF